VGGQRNALAALLSNIIAGPIAQTGEGPPGSIWLGAENIGGTGVRSSDTQSLVNCYNVCSNPAHPHLEKLNKTDKVYVL
jgi:hypothetical protein